MGEVDLIVMSGRSGTSAAEQMVNGAKAAITRDLVEQALHSGSFASIIVSTNDRALAERVGGLPTVVVELDPEDETFHFGKRLQWLIQKHRVERLVYVGGGSGPLLPASTLRNMAEQVRKADRLLLVNNFYSVDLCAFTPASAFLAVEPPPNDNSLGWLLGKGAGLPPRELERSAATLFDVDTPTDLVILSFHPEVRPHTRAYLDSLSFDTQRIRAASAVFLDRCAEVIVSGRISSRAMAYLERETLCRTRVFSEERGMRADGRLAGGKVSSLLGMHLASVGAERFFQEVIPALGQSAFLDDRVLWAHFRIWPLASDRFNSDLLNPAEIVDPFVRQFTEAAMSCPVPVVLGGHSLVAGGLYVLVDAAWAHSGLDIQRTVQFA
jgi:CTP:molybdopterin cytidylyltransferase MocA